jgi:hypothetical protein
VFSVPLSDILAAAHTAGLLKESALAVLDDAQRRLDACDARASSTSATKLAEKSSAMTREPVLMADVRPGVDAVRLKVCLSESTLRDVPLFELGRCL